MNFKLKYGNYFLAFCAIVGGIVILWLSKLQKLAFIKNSLPGPGFFPIICGIGISACGVLLLIGNFLSMKRAAANPDEADPDLEKNIVNTKELKNLVFVIGGSIAVYLLTKYIGLLTAIGIMVFVLVKFMAKEKWLTSILVGLGTTVVLYAIFALFLKVPLPKGPLGF